MRGKRTQGKGGRGNAKDGAKKNQQRKRSEEDRECLLPWGFGMRGKKKRTKVTKGRLYIAVSAIRRLPKRTKEKKGEKGDKQKKSVMKRKKKEPNLFGRKRGSSWKVLEKGASPGAEGGGKAAHDPRGLPRQACI